MFTAEENEKKYTRTSFIELSHSEDSLSDKSGGVKVSKNDKTSYHDHAKLIRENIIVLLYIII